MENQGHTSERFRGQAVVPLPPAGSPSVTGMPSVTGVQSVTGRLPVTGTIDDSDTPNDVIDLLALEEFSTGRQPFSRSQDLENVRAEATLLPPGAQVCRDAQSTHQHSLLAVGAGWTLRAVRSRRSRHAVVTVTAVTAELARRQLELAVEGAVEPPSEVEERVEIGFWHKGQHGPRRMPREIEAASWDEIRGNYSASVASALEPVMALDAASLNGRLLLLHGPPGTGKTTLLRAIARQWRRWCQVDCVLDPEMLFGDLSYLLHVALGTDDDENEEGEGPRWRMLLLEDCDELIRGEAKSAAGQRLSRLLNLTDGLLGQGRRVLVAVTTNEDLAALHPAVVRPGRSLAQIEVGRLGPAEVTAWLSARGHVGGAPSSLIGPQGATLAELFALTAAEQAPVVTSRQSAGTGLYL